MSWKVYSGFKVQNASFEIVAKMVDEFQEAIKPVIDEKLSKVLLRMAVDAIDAAALSGSPAPSSPFGDAVSSYLDTAEERNAKGLRFPGKDFGVSISLFPFEGAVYGMTHAEDRDLENLWKSAPNVVDFAYWDNSDPPESVSEEEWAERSRVWSAIFEKESTPAKAGFGRECASSVQFPDVEYVSRHWRGLMPSWEERIEFATKDIFLKNRLQGIDPEDVCISDLRRAAQDDSPEANLEREVIRTALRKKLKESLTELDLGLPERPLRMTAKM